MAPLTVLITLRDRLARMVIERSIVRSGHQFVSASDGHLACSILQQQKVDVCILEWETPLMSGIEICKWLRSTPAAEQPEVLLMLKTGSPEEVQAAFEAGADDYVTGPVDLKYMERRLAAVAQKEHRIDGMAPNTQRTGPGQSADPTFIGNLLNMNL